MAEGAGSPFLNPHEPGYGGGPLYSDQDGAVMLEHGENGARRVRLDFNVLRRQNIMPNGTNSIRLIFARGYGGEERLALGFRRVDPTPPPPRSASTPTVIEAEAETSAPVASSSQLRQQEPQPGPSTRTGNNDGSRSQKRKSSEGTGGAPPTRKVKSGTQKTDGNQATASEEQQQPVQANNDMIKQLGEMYSVMTGMLTQLDTLNKKTEGFKRAAVKAKPNLGDNPAKSTPSSDANATEEKLNTAMQTKPKVEETVVIKPKLKEAVAKPKSESHSGGTVIHPNPKPKVEKTVAQSSKGATAPAPAKPASSSLCRIYVENRKKARLSHLAFRKLSPSAGAPLYRQPSDTTVYHRNNASYADFKPKLQKYFKNKMEKQRRGK